MRKNSSPNHISDDAQNEIGHSIKDEEARTMQRMGLRLTQMLVFKNAIAMAFVTALFLPFSIYAYLMGETVPLILSAIVFGVSLISVVSGLKSKNTVHPKNRLIFELAGLVAGGLVLTIADPAWIDPGLAILLLIPVHMVFARSQFGSGNFHFVMLFLTLFSGLFIGGIIPNLLAGGTIIEWTGAAFFLTIVFLQLYAAHRLNQFGQDRSKAHNDAVRHLAEKMGDGYVSFSVEGKVQFVSDLTHDLLGTSRFDLSGQGLVDRVHILDRPRFLKGLSDAVHTNSTKIIEARIRKDNAELSSGVPQYLWIEVYFSPLVDLNPHKEKWRVIALLRDISMRKEREFELIEARKNAELATKTKSGFLATIGHELRTPLNAIVGFSEMMSNGIGGKLEPAHVEYTKLIFQSGHHLLDVVNMLLDMSKIEAGKFELQLTSFEPCDLVRPCMQMIEASAADKRVRLVADLQQNLPSLTGDERACRQILINLLSNAVKFSEPGSEVQVRVKRQGQRLSISVSDTGIGMSREAIARAGEAFFQANDGLARQYEGTGLGLSIVKGLVELHEGSIKIDSELGKGTKISVLLPIHGPQSKFVEPEIITPLLPKTNTSQPGPWSEQKRVAQ